MDERKKIAIGVPCYNEEVALPQFIEAMSSNDDMKELSKKYDFVFIFVDDGSKDNTLTKMQELAFQRNDIYFISFERNYGKEAALVAIYDAAIRLNVDALIKMDVDLQDPIDLIPKFIEEWNNGYQYVYGHMTSRKGQSKMKKMFSSFYYFLFSIVVRNKGMKDGDRDFSLMDKSVIPFYAMTKGPHRFDRSLSSHFNLKRKSISYDFVLRADGTTRWSFKKLFLYSLDSVKQFGDLWIFLTRLGCALSIIAFIILRCLAMAIGGTALTISSYVMIGLFALFSILSICLTYNIEKLIISKNKNYEMYKIKISNIQS